jgi:hypothetical protein
MTAKVVQVGPVMAKKLLKRNSNNRPIRRRFVNTLCRAMKSDQWVLNGESIIVSKRGRLLDGQHRLMAVIDADKAVPMLVVEVGGDEDRVFKTIDTGNKRQFGDYLALKGVRYFNTVASALLMLRRYQLGVFLQRQSYSHTDLYKLYLEEIGITHSVEWVRGAKQFELRVMGQASLLAFLHYLFGQLCSKKRDLFFDQLTLHKPPQDTVSTLRRKLLLDTNSNNRLSRVERAALVIKAWNAFVSDRPIHSLRWGRTEAFPVATIV